MNRKQLQEEYKTLRNAQMTKPREHEGVRARNIYLDFLNDSDILAESKTDSELLAAILRMRG